MVSLKCHRCGTHSCSKGEPCVPFDSVPLYDSPEDRALLKAASDLEALYYCRLNRVRETMEFARRLGFRKLGLAFCAGFQDEAALLAKVLEKEFELHSACCKVAGVPKSTFDVELRDWVGPTSCNPIEQARILCEAGCELNIVMGLCVGHDSLFYKHSRVPVTTLIVKDRVLGHNPVSALYCPYIRAELNDLPEERLK